MAIKLMQMMKKMEKVGEAIEDVQSAKRSKGDLVKGVTSRKAKNSLMKMLK